MPQVERAQKANDSRLGIERMRAWADLPEADIARLFEAKAARDRAVRLRRTWRAIEDSGCAELAVEHAELLGGEDRIVELVDSARRDGPEAPLRLRELLMLSTDRMPRHHGGLVELQLGLPRTIQTRAGPVTARPWRAPISPPRSPGPRLHRTDRRDLRPLLELREAYEPPVAARLAAEARSLGRRLVHNWATRAVDALSASAKLLSSAGAERSGRALSDATTFVHAANIALDRLMGETASALKPGPTRRVDPFGDLETLPIMAVETKPDTASDQDAPNGAWIDLLREMPTAKLPSTPEEYERWLAAQRSKS